MAEIGLWKSSSWIPFICRDALPTTVFERWTSLKAGSWSLQNREPVFCLFFLNCECLSVVLMSCQMLFCWNRKLYDLSPSIELFIAVRWFEHDVFAMWSLSGLLSLKLDWSYINWCYINVQARYITKGLKCCTHVRMALWDVCMVINVLYAS